VVDDAAASLYGCFCRWLSRPTELCCRDGPDGGAGLLGKKPKKLLDAPPCSGRPLNGCRMPLEAWQPVGKNTRRRTSKNQQGGCNTTLLLLLLSCQQHPMSLASRARTGEGEKWSLADGKCE
jgi:hypothetical protein